MRAGRGDGVELRQGEVGAIAGELHLAPAAQRHQPLSFGQGAGLGFEQLQGVAAARHAIEPRFVGPVLGRPHDVIVVVDESGDDGASAEVRAPRAGIGERLDRCVAADGHDALAAQGDRLAD